jgi:hypothetical protein
MLMRASEPDITARLDALFGKVADVTVRPTWQVLKVLKYVGDQEALSMRTSRALSEVR